MTAKQYPGLQWTGLQGFKTRSEARQAASATAAYQDPARPGMRWVVKDIRQEGPGQWRADHYLIQASVMATVPASYSALRQGPPVPAGWTAATEELPASIPTGQLPADRARTGRRHCAWTSCSVLYVPTDGHMAGPYCGGQACPGTRQYRDNRPRTAGPVPTGARMLTAVCVECGQEFRGLRHPDETPQCFACSNRLMADAFLAALAGPEASPETLADVAGCLAGEELPLFAGNPVSASTLATRPHAGHQGPPVDGCAECTDERAALAGLAPRPCPAAIGGRCICHDVAHADRRGLADATGHAAAVWHPGGRIQTVQNLGWLLRHASDVQSIEFWTRTRQDAPDRDFGGMLTARLADGRVYRTDWASRAVFVEWIARPSFRHITPEYI